MFTRNTVLIALLLFLYSSVCIAAEEDWPLEITWPPRLSGYRVNAQNCRIAGYTHPEAKLLVNGKDTKVYPTGAFVAYLPIDYGNNEIIVTATIKGIEQIKNLKVRRPLPPEPFPDWPPQMKQSSLFPGVPHELQPGDLLHFSCTAGTDNIITVQVGDTRILIPLNESAANKGSYSASWRIPEDFAPGEVYFTYRLTSLTGLTAEEKPEDKLIVLEKGSVDWLVSRVKKTTLYDSPGNGRAGEIEAGVLLPVTGLIGDALRLGLGEQRTFWISKPNSINEVELPQETEIQGIVTSDIKKKSGLTEMMIEIDIPVKLPYYLWSDKDTNSVYLEIFQTSLTEAPVLEIPEWFPGRVEIENERNDRVLVKVTAEGDRFWGYSAGYEINSDINDNKTNDLEKLLLKIKCQSRNEPPPGLANLDIMIDPGHGGKDPGTLSPTNKREKDINLEISRTLESLLEEAGANVFMVRENDSYLSLADRVQMIEDEDIDLFISIHNNSVADSTNPIRVKGSTVYYSHDVSEALAGKVNDFLKDLEVGSLGLRKANFAVITPTRVPCILVECAYMSNPENEMFLLEDTSRDVLSLSIFNGIKDFASRTDLPAAE